MLHFVAIATTMHFSGTPIGCHLTTKADTDKLEDVHETIDSFEEGSGGRTSLRRVERLAYRGWGQSCMGTDFLPLQRRRMSVWRVLHNKRLEYTEEHRESCKGDKARGG